MSEEARQPTLWVIDPSIREPEDQGVEQVLLGWPGRHRVFRPALRGEGPRPGDGYDVDGVVLLGSGASVHDTDRPWLGPLGAWLAPLLEGEREVAVLGICFGHQWIAHYAGAPIVDLNPDGSKRVGVEESRLEGGRLLPGEHSLRTVVSHRETVGAAPAGYDVVASRPGVDVDGIEHRRLDVYAFQFHPEARDEFAGRRGIAPAAIDRRLIEDSGRLLAAFRRLVLRRAAERP